MRCLLGVSAVAQALGLEEAGGQGKRQMWQSPLSFPLEHAGDSPTPS